MCTSEVLSQLLDRLKTNEDSCSLKMKINSFFSSGIVNCPPAIRVQVWNLNIGPPGHDNTQIDTSDADYKQILMDLKRFDTARIYSVCVSKYKEPIAVALYGACKSIPATGYVQGFHEWAVPIFLTYLAAELGCEVSDISDDRPEASSDLSFVIAQTFQAIRQIILSISEFYVSGMPGIDTLATLVETIICRADPVLHQQFVINSLNLNQLVLRWANCLFSRDFNYDSWALILDTLVVEQNKYRHVAFLAAALIIQQRDTFYDMKFEELCNYCRQSPTANWPPDKVRILIAQAFTYTTFYGDSPRHLANIELVQR